MRIAVLGAGAWGTALAIAFGARHAVNLWARDAARVAEMSRRRENARYLPECPFPGALQVTADFGAALSGTGSTGYGLIMQFIAVLFYFAYIYYITNINPLGVFWVWVAEILYWAVMITLVRLFLRSERWHGVKF